MPVYLIGSGPGDPDLISVKGLRCIESADVIIYDYLAPAELLAHAPKGCELVYVGKKGGQTHITQDEINAILVDKAKPGGNVARLKGGDPFVFGRGGEEALVLAEHGIPFEIVPGVTSGIAAPAYAGIPVTHRGLSSTFAVCTAHEDPTKPESAIDWDALARLGTVCFYMGARNLPNVAKKLVAAGKPPETPVAVIRWGATYRQETVVGTLADIVEKAAHLAPPVMTVVGEVAGLREQLKWFESKPLFGRTVLVTRTRQQASELRERLVAQGARVIEMPTIQIVEPTDWSAADAAMDELASFDWIVFTSPNGVSRFMDRLAAQGHDARALALCDIAVIGPATNKRLAECHLMADLAPEVHTSEGLLEAFAKIDLSGARVLLARAEDVPDVLPVGLAEQGAEVVEAPVYKTVLPDTFDEQALDALAAGEVDVVTFTSSSTVENFKKCLESAGVALPPAMRYASIGPVTTETAQRLGFDVQIEAEGITIASLVDAIVQRLAGVKRET